MIPKVVASILPAPIDLIAMTGDYADLIIATYKIAAKTGPSRGTFFRFVNSLLKAAPELSRSQAASLYRAGSYWTTQGKVISQYPASVPIDPRLARGTTTKDPYLAERSPYRYTVDITVSDPDTGRSHTKYYVVPSADLLTPGQAYSMALSELERTYETSPLTPGKHDVEMYSLSYEISDFAHLTY